MITALICVISIAAFAQFFVFYCRFVLTRSAAVVLSEDVLRIACVNIEGPGPDDFARIRELMHLCPDAETRQKQVSAVGAYYKALGLIDLFSRTFPSNFAAWAVDERRQCSHFAAVVLDQRISFSRSLRAQSVNAI